MSLENWLQNSWLVQHVTSVQEIANLLALADRDLAACQVKDLPADWRFTIAYNAALQAATAALAAAGYRASRDNQHHRGFRKKRNVSSYDLAGAVSDAEAAEMFTLAKELREEVENWIRATRPELL